MRLFRPAIRLGQEGRRDEQTKEKVESHEGVSCQQNELAGATQARVALKDPVGRGESERECEQRSPGITVMKG